MKWEAKCSDTFWNVILQKQGKFCLAKKYRKHKKGFFTDLPNYGALLIFGLLFCYVCPFA